VHRDHQLASERDADARAYRYSYSHPNGKLNTDAYPDARPDSNPYVHAALDPLRDDRG